MPESLISASNIHLYRGKKKILDDVSLSINPDDFITIVGPNGAGKSTLLKCLLGLLPIEQGQLHRQDNLRIGYVPQRIMPELTVPLRLHRFLTINKKVDANVVESVADLTGISHYLNRPLATLSGGEMQRALLARALINQPMLLALDEPAQNLDINGELEFYRLLEKIYKHRSMAIVMISHDLRFVMRLSRQVVCLHHHICCRGTPQMVSQDPAFETLFGSDMARMMAVYQHDHDHNHHINSID